MKLEIPDDLYVDLMTALRELELRQPRYIRVRKQLMHAMLAASTAETKVVPLFSKLSRTL